MGYIGAGPTRFNTADELTVTGDAEFNGNLTVKGTTTTIDSASVQTIDLGDNDKIRLGDSDDLQIFHDGSNSWINEVGTGQLILAGEDVRITTPNAGEFMATFGVNGAATLYYDNAAKIATTATGVDVTGTVTASGDVIRNDPTLGTSKFALQYSGADAAVFKRNNSTGVATIANGYAGAPVDAININLTGNVGIGVSSMTNKLVLPNAAYFAMQDTGGAESLAIRANSSNAMEFLTSGGVRATIGSSGFVSIGGSETSVFTGAGEDMKFVVIGDDSATNIVNNSNAGIAIVNTNQTAGNLAGLHFARADTDDNPNYAGASIVAQFPEAQVTGQYPKGDLAFLTSTAANNAPSEKMRIAASGNVGIGQASPLAKLDIQGNTDTYGSMAKIYLTDYNSNSNSRNWSIGNGGSAYGNLTFAVSAAKDGVAGDNTSINAMVINPSGNVGIGTTSPNQKLSVAGAIESTSTSTAFYATGVGNYNQQNGSGGTAWAYGSGGGTAAPGTASTTFGMHHWNGNSWKNTLNIDTSGRVTMPYQPVFSGNRFGLATVNGLNSNVNFTPVVNQGNHWNTSTHSFTCPVAGKYWVSVFNLNYTALNSGASNIQINKNNGSVFTAYQDSPSGTNYHNSSASGVLSCAANDVITFFSPAGVVYGDQYCGATVYLIG